MEGRQKLLIGISAYTLLLAYLLYESFQHEKQIKELKDSMSNNNGNGRGDSNAPNPNAAPTSTPATAPVPTPVPVDNGMATDAQFDEFLNTISGGGASVFMGFNILDISKERNGFKSKLTKQDADLLIRMAKSKSGSLPESIQLVSILTKFLGK